MRSAGIIALSLLLAACGADAPPPVFGFSRSDLTLSQLAANSGCTTAGTEGIANQLVDEMLCLADGKLTRFAPHTGVTLTSSRVHPYLSPAGRDRLYTPVRSKSVSITSALRTIAEQYVLWRNCAVAADPGRSNHETGRAIDVSNYTTAGSALVNAGFTHPLPSSDPVHYEAPGEDLRSKSVLAFQTLWNANHPSDRIAADGLVGPETMARLARAPAGGFAVGRSCGVVTTPALRAEFVAQSFPLASRGVVELRAGEEVAGWIEMKNTGTRTWDALGTKLATSVPRDRASPVRATGWLSANRVAAVARAIAPGQTARFSFSLRGPAAPGDYDEHFALVQEGVAWFSDRNQGGPADDALRIRVRVGAPRFAATLVRTTFPESLQLAVGDVAEGAFELRNTGTETWQPGVTFLGTTMPRDRASVFAEGWVNAGRAATVAAPVAPGAVGRFVVKLRAPAMLGPFDEGFGLVHEGVAWFGDDQQGGPEDEALRVRGLVVPAGAAVPLPGTTPPTVITPPPGGSAGAGAGGDGAGVGGCAISSSGDLALFALLAIALSLWVLTTARSNRRN